MSYEKKPKKYLTNASLLEQIKLSKEQGKMTEDLGKMTLMLVDKYAMAPQYYNIYSYKDDMKAFAVFTLCKTWQHFNPDKSNNPFAYYTQISKHAFYQYVNMEKRQREIKDMYSIDLGIPHDLLDKFNDEAGRMDAEVTEHHFMNGQSPEPKGEPDPK